MTPPNPSPTDLDRLAAEALGYVYRPASAYSTSDFEVRHSDEWLSPTGNLLHVPASRWHPTQSHDQCQLLVDELVKRGLQREFVHALEQLIPETHEDWVIAQAQITVWIVTAPAYEKCLAATRVLQKGE